MTVANNYHDHSFFYLNNRTMLEEELTYFQSNDLSPEPTATIDNKNLGDYKTSADTFNSNENNKNDVLMNATLNGIKINKVPTSSSVVNNNNMDISDRQNDTNIIDKKANKRNNELGKNGKVVINSNNTKDNINSLNKIKKNKINNTNNNNLSNNKNGININSKNSSKNNISNYDNINGMTDKKKRNNSVNSVKRETLDEGIECNNKRLDNNGNCNYYNNTHEKVAHFFDDNNRRNNNLQFSQKCARDMANEQNSNVVLHNNEKGDHKNINKRREDKNMNMNLLNNSIIESSSCNMYNEEDFKNFDSSINNFNYVHSINNKLDLKDLNNIMKYSNNLDKNKQLYGYNDSYKVCCTKGNNNEGMKMSENNLMHNYSYTDCYKNDNIIENSHRKNETNGTNINTCSTGNNIYKNIEKNNNNNNSRGFNHNCLNSSDDNICNNKNCEKNADNNINENNSTNNDGIGNCDNRKHMEENGKNDHGSEGNDDKGDNKNKNKNTNNSKNKGNNKSNKNKNGNKKNKKNGNQNVKNNPNNNGEDKTDQKNDTPNGKYLHGNTNMTNNKTLKHNTETNNISVTPSNKSAIGNSGSKKNGNNLINLIISDKYSNVVPASTTNTNNNHGNISDNCNEIFEKNKCACIESNSILFQDRDIKYGEKNERIIMCDNDNKVTNAIDENKSNDIVNLNNTINLLKNNIYNAFNDTFNEKTTESIYFSKKTSNNDVDRIIENTGNLKKKKKKIQNNNIIDSNNMSTFLSHTKIPIFDAEMEKKPGMNQINQNILQNKFGLNDERENNSMTNNTYTSTSINDSSITQLHNGMKLSLIKTYDINKSVDNSIANNSGLNINMSNNTLNTTNQSTEMNENTSTRFSQNNSLNQHKETNINYNRYNNEKNAKENSNSLNLRKIGNNNMCVERPVILNNSQMLQAFMQGRLCLSCDSLDHPMPLCPNNSFVCPNCHNISHRGNDCPMKCRFCLKYHIGISIMDCLKKARIQNEKKLLNKGKNDINNNSNENNNKIGKNNKNNNEKTNVGPRFDITTRPDNSYGRSVYVSNLSDEITNIQLRDAINNQLDNGFVVNIDRQNGYAFVELSNLNSTFQLVQRSININYKKLKIQFKKTGQFLIPDNLSFNSNNVSQPFNLNNNENTQNKLNKSCSNAHVSNKNSSTTNNASNLGTIQNNFISNHIHFDFSTQIKDSHMKTNANIVNNITQNDTNNITVNNSSNNITNPGNNNCLLHLDNMEKENGCSSKFYYETQRKSQLQQFNQTNNLKKYKEKDINNLCNNIGGNCNGNIIDAHFSSKVFENIKQTAQLNERNEGGNNLLCNNSNKNIKFEKIGINNYCNKNGNIVDSCSNYQIKDLSNYYNMNKNNGKSDNLIKQNNLYDFMSFEDENILNDYLKKKNINRNNNISPMDIANMEERNNHNFNDNMFLKFINHITNDQNKLNNTIINERTKTTNSTINNNLDTLLNSHLFNNRSLLLKENNNNYNKTIEDNNVPDLSSSNIYLKNDNNLTEYNSSTDDNNMFQKYIHENNKLMDSSTTLDIKSIIDNAIEINHGTIGSDEMNFTSTINSNSASSNNSGCSYSNGIHKADTREYFADENSYNMTYMCSNNDHNNLTKNNRRSIYINNNNNIQNFKREIEQDKLFNQTNFSFHTFEDDKNCNGEKGINQFFWKECNNNNSNSNCGSGNNDGDILSQGQTGYKNICNDILYRTNPIYDIYKKVNSIKNNSPSIDNCNQRACEGNYNFSNGVENASSNNFDNVNYDFKTQNNDILFNNINNEKTEDIHKLNNDTIHYNQHEQINFTDIDINKIKSIFNNQNMEMLNNNSYMKNMKYKEIDAIEKDLESHIKVLWNLRKIKLGESYNNTK
ncbi:hypothetical protein [Plasmodium yoelii yoelii]|uniref:RRM domain-containing protein n=3 Tax=Plasmodium yoelii TaxID=5861 RepID=Q7RJ00_PLAYO|nr:hypothetical protein [Plasmodium yoelii yoelii]